MLNNLIQKLQFVKLIHIFPDPAVFLILTIAVFLNMSRTLVVLIPQRSLWLFLKYPIVNYISYRADYVYLRFILFISCFVGPLPP